VVKTAKPTRSIAVDVRDFVGCIGQHTRDQEVSALAVRASECAGGLPRKVVGFGTGLNLTLTDPSSQVGHYTERLVDERWSNDRLPAVTREWISSATTAEVESVESKLLLTVTMTE